MSEVMSEDTPRHKGLGRGLSALLGDDGQDFSEPDRGRSARELPIEFLRPNPFQPRRRFTDQELAELVKSIREHGILQPILVRRVPGETDAYEIVAGERRWRAAQMVPLHQVPVLIKDLTDDRMLEIALVENIQREALTPIEEAAAYQRLVDQFGHTQDDLARFLGKSRSHVANTLRLLGLPETVKAMIEDARLTAGHARALIGVDDPEAMAQRIIAEGLSVRVAEQLAQAAKPKGRGRATKAPPAKDADTVALEHDISAALGLGVDIRHHGAKGGEIRVMYGSLEQLDEVCRRLCHK